MHDLVLYKSDYFQGVECDFWKNENNEVHMTSEQLGCVLGYNNPQKSISKLVERNEYLRNSNFSTIVKMTTPSGKQDTRFFTEDGIYEVAFLSKTEKAKQFRTWVREILKGIRKGELELIRKQLEEYKPKLELYNQCLDAKNNLTMLQASKILKLKGRNKLFKFLRDEKILMSKEKHKNIPYQQYLEQKYFDLVLKPMLIQGNVINIPVCLVTSKGLQFILKRLNKSNIQKIS